MYSPYLRGRQYELLAIGELIDNNLLNDHVIPVVEPVKLSFTLIHVMFNQKGGEMTWQILKILMNCLMQ